MRLFSIKQKWTLKRRIGVGLAIIAVSVPTGIAIAEEFPDLTSPSPTGIAKEIPSELAAAFAVLRRPPQPSDIPPATALTPAITEPGGVGQHYGVNPQLSRLAGQFHESPVWLVPGTTGSCLLESSGASVCGPNELAIKQGFLIGALPTAAGASSVEGIVPDNASVTAKDAGGTQRSVPLVNQTYVLSGVNTASFTIHLVSGLSEELPMPSGPPPASPVDVTEVSPTEGSTAGGAAVNITGNNLAGATAVKFGSTNATSFAVKSTGTSIAAVAPAGTGTVDVTVTAAAGTSAPSSVDQFIYRAVPVVTGVKPNKGCAHQPLPVEISGAGFSGAKAVHFGEDEVRSFTVVSDNVITATTPQYTGNALEEGGGLLGISKHVTVTTAGGTSAQSSADEFFFTVGC